MEQRPLRLGDIVDDYCPRERRITNHTIVALVGETIRQTRCSTCDTEHVYKEGRDPKRRKKDVPIADDKPVVETPGQLVSARRMDAEPESAPPPLAAAASSEPPAEADASDSTGSSNGEEAGVESPWFGHRRLIRATLPRVEGEPPAPRPIPEFTMHQRPPARNGFRNPQHANWRGNGGQPNGNGNAFRHGRSPEGNGNSAAPFGGQGRRGKPGRHRGGRHKRSR